MFNSSEKQLYFGNGSSIDMHNKKAILFIASFGLKNGNRVKICLIGLSAV